MARLVEAGRRGALRRLLDRDASLPDGFPPDTLAHEVREATAELGIPAEHLTVHDFDVRTFPEHRQEILELLIELWNDWQPDVVFQPSLHDIHQDHQTIAAEGLRAFKRTTILGYEIPWNNFDFAYQAYFALEQRHLERKAAALEQLRLAAAPPLRERRVRLEPRADARHQREPRVRRGVPGVPGDRVAPVAPRAHACSPHGRTASGDVETCPAGASDDDRACRGRTGILRARDTSRARRARLRESAEHGRVRRLPHRRTTSSLRRATRPTSIGQVAGQQMMKVCGDKIPPEVIKKWQRRPRTRRGSSPRVHRELGGSRSRGFGRFRSGPSSGFRDAYVTCRGLLQANGGTDGGTPAAPCRRSTPAPGPIA